MPLDNNYQSVKTPPEWRGFCLRSRQPQVPGHPPERHRNQVLDHTRPVPFTLTGSKQNCCGPTAGEICLLLVSAPALNSPAGTSDAAVCPSLIPTGRRGTGV